MRNILEKCQMKDILQNTWLVLLLKAIKVMKIWTVQETVNIQEEPKETGQFNGMW